MYQKSYSKEKSLRVKIAENKAVIYYAYFGGCFGSGNIKKTRFWCWKRRMILFFSLTWPKFSNYTKN